MKSIAIIGARLNSSRLPNKHLLPLAGQPLIHRVITRLQKCVLLEAIVVATTDDNFNLPLVDIVKPLVPVTAFSGNVNNLMARLDSVITFYNPDFITYICGDCPLVEPKFIDHALTLLAANKEKHSVKLKNNVSSIHEGMAFYSREGWNKLMSVSHCPMSQEHVGYGDTLTPILDKLEINDCDDFTSVNHRISVDTLADYQFMQTIYLSWYSSHDASSIVDLKWVQKQLKAHPELLKINQHVIQKAPNQTYNKISCYSHFSKNIGIGHFKRCQFLSESVKECLGLGVELHLIGDSHSSLKTDSTTVLYPDLEAMLYQMETDKNPLWILDFHPEHVDIEKLRSALKYVKQVNKTRIIALDKLSNIIDVVDELFIPSFYSKIQGSKISYGWDHILFSKPENHIKLDQLLVLTGGSDALNYGEYLPTLIESIAEKNIHLHWVQGPLAPSPQFKTNSRWHIHKNPNNLPELIAQSKIIFTCYGLSLFESMASGNLVLLLPVKHLCDEEEVFKLKSADCCLVTSSEDFVIKIHDAINNYERFKYMQKNALNILQFEAGLANMRNHIIRQLSIFHSQI